MLNVDEAAAALHRASSLVDAAITLTTEAAEGLEPRLHGGFQQATASLLDAKGYLNDLHTQILSKQGALDDPRRPGH